jgi:hypothetical protein
MRTFDHFSKGVNCPICGTDKDSPPVLVPIEGTNKDGGMNYEAVQVHLECIDLFMHKDYFNDGDALIAMKFAPKGG